MLAFWQAHSAAITGLSVAILDFVFAINPKAESNGVLHLVYGWIKGMVSKTPPSA